MQRGSQEAGDSWVLSSGEGAGLGWNNRGVGTQMGSREGQKRDGDPSQSSGGQLCEARVQEVSKKVEARGMGAKPGGVVGARKSQEERAVCCV